MLSKPLHVLDIEFLCRDVMINEVVCQLQEGIPLGKSL